MKPIYITAILLLLFPMLSLGQKGIIKGRVIDEKNNVPLPFTNIIIYGTTIGTTSDVDGFFTFTGINPGYIKLEASSIGYEKKITESFLVTNAKITNIDIILREDQIHLNEVLIKTTPFEKKIESPVSMRRLEISEIEKSPGGNRDISKVIQVLPGVASSVSYRNDIIVRGGGSFENRFYLDEVEIPNINHFATQGSSGGPVGIINTDFIRDVDFYSGSFPANKGNSLSSILDIKLIDGNKEKMQYKATLGASDLAITANGPVSKKTSIIFSARRSYLQFLFSALGLPFLPTYNDFQFKSKTKINAKNEISFIGLGAIDQFKLNLTADSTDAQKYILSYIPVNEQWNYTNGFVYKHFRDNSYDVWILSRNMLRNKSYKYYQNIEIDTLKTFDYKSDEIENKFRFENHKIKNGFNVVIGAGAEYAEYANTTFRKTFVNNAPFTINYSTSLNLFKWNGFGQISRSFFDDKYSLSFGIRSDANNYSASMSNMLKQISPSLSASMYLAPKISANASIGRYMQLAPYTTLGYKDNAGILINKQNNLKYISVIHYVAGLEFKPMDYSIITIEGFYKDYSNYPFSVKDSIAIASKGTDFGSFGDEEVTSTSKGKAYGLELLARAQMKNGLKFILSYTYVRSLFQNNSIKYIPSAWDNRNIINLTASKTFKKNWQFGVKWRYLGGSPYTPYDLNKSSIIAAWDAQGAAYLDYSQFNKFRTKSAHQMDIRLDKVYYLSKWTLNMYIDIQNVYNYKVKNADYITRATDANGQAMIDPNDPNRYLLKTIPNVNGTILPTLGIIIEF
ncbi:MAG: TonB-dependent receptor [Bacteroidota bacterium]